MRERATGRPLRSFASGLFLCLSMTATDLVAAPNDAAGPRAPDGVVPVPPAAGSPNWPSQVSDRILQNRKFPANGYCREGIVHLLFLIDRSGKLLSSEITESSNVPAFDAEALAILKRAQPFPPPPEGMGARS
jgi:periplasmic protein TonB